MAIVSLNRKEVEKIIGTNDESKIDYTLSLFSTAIEAIDNDKIDVEVAPNRPDMLSEKGLLRALRSFLGKKTGLIEYKVKEPEKDYEVIVEKSVLEVRPYTACAIIKGIEFNDEKIKEVIDIQEKIHTTLGRNRKKIAIGIYPLEKITLPIRFEAKAPNEIKFIPLEAHAEMTGRQILSSHPTGKEYAHLLEGEETFPIFIDGNNEILSMPPIINSHKTGKITETTKEVFIECSGFDLPILKKTINILATMFAEMGGTICQIKVKHKEGNYITPDLTPEKMKLNPENVKKLLGLDLSEREISKLLEKMGYNFNRGETEIPAWRTDILHENDLIEDIAIAYGYDKFIPAIPNIVTAGQCSEIEIKKRKISDILTGINITEISNYHLTTQEDQFKNLGIKKENFVESEGSKTEYSILRKNLLHYLLKNLSNNLDSEYPQKIFETGSIFQPDNNQETGIKEKQNLAIALAHTTAGFTEIKQILDYLMRMLDKEYKIEQSEEDYFIEGRCGKILVNNKPIGILGEIKPQILNTLKIKMPVTCLEMNIEEL